MTAKTYKLMIVAGEPSGDAHAAKLVAKLREREPDAAFEFFGATSNALRAENVEETVNADEFAIVGLPEIARALPMFLSAFGKLKTAARNRRPDAAILVDFPEFNLKLARSLKKLGIPVVYYISPQLWAWRKYRISTIRRDVDLLLTILPFEKAWYAERGVHHVEHVGNPMASEVYPAVSRVDFRRKHAVDPNAKLIALLPGSRGKEISRILPVMLETAALMQKRDASLRFVVPLAATRKSGEVDAAISTLRSKGISSPADLIVVQNETYDAVSASDAAAVTSGTATLETALLGTPLVVVYKGSSFNYRILRPLIDVEHFGLVNLIAGKRLAKEMIQDDCRPEPLAEELFRLMTPQINEEMRGELAIVKEKLGGGGASERAASRILELLNRIG